MNLQTLKRHADHAGVLSHILAGYDGPCSIGIGRGAQEGELAFIVRVATEDVDRFPTSIELEGEMVNILVKSGYVEPRFEHAGGAASLEG